MRIVVATALALLVCSCSSPSYDTNTGRFLIEANKVMPPSLAVGHGQVNVMVGNWDAAPHDLILVPAGRLPLKPDGTVDESRLDGVVYNSGLIKPNGLNQQIKNLKAGTYLAFSNIGQDYRHQLFTIFVVH